MWECRDVVQETRFAAAQAKATRSGLDLRLTGARWTAVRNPACRLHVTDERAVTPAQLAMANNDQHQV